MTLKDKLQATIAELHANPSLEVVSIPQRAVTPALFEKLEAIYGTPVPEEFSDLLLDVGRVMVKWRSWADPEVCGEVSLDAFSALIRPPKTFKSAKKIMVANNLYFMPDKGHFAFIGPLAKPDATKPRETTRKLAATFEEAFGLMLRARGFNGWAQAYFGAWPGSSSEAQHPRLGLFQAAAPALFPDLDLKRFGSAAKIPPADIVPLDQPAFDLSPEQAGLSFAARLQRRIRITAQVPVRRYFDIKFNPPATQAEVDAAQAAMDFQISERFINYFRSCNGFQFSFVDVAFGKQSQMVDDDALRTLWREYREGGGVYGSVRIPPLQEIFTPRAMPPMAIDSPYDDARFFGYVDDPLPDGHSANTWHMLAVDLRLSRAHPNPVLVMAEDYGADLTARVPVDAVTYLEWLCLSLGEYNDHKDVFQIGSTAGPVRQATAQALGAYLPRSDPFTTRESMFTREFWES